MAYRTDNIIDILSRSRIRMAAGASAIKSLDQGAIESFINDIVEMSDDYNSKVAGLQQQTRGGYR